MAMLDDLIGGVVTAVAGDKAPALNQFLQDNGGVNGLAQKFQTGGAGEVFSSCGAAAAAHHVTQACISLAIRQRRAVAALGLTFEALRISAT